MTSIAPLVDAAKQAPAQPGVYFFLDADGLLLYVGKAGNLRHRLQQHARGPADGGRRLAAMYHRTAEVRWAPCQDEDAAAAYEADLIVALRPVFNASHTTEARWNYILVDSRADGRASFVLSPDMEAAPGRAYGCFPHLGRGVSSRPAIACSDGYTAMLRLLWAAAPADADRHMPARITRSAPDRFEGAVEPSWTPALHAFLSGTSPRLLALLEAATTKREAYLQPALARDREAAAAFFAYGPRAIRSLRLRHGRPPGPLGRTDIERLLAEEVRASIGDFRVPEPTTSLVGDRTARSRAIADAIRGRAHSR